RGGAAAGSAHARTGYPKRGSSLSAASRGTPSTTPQARPQNSSKVGSRETREVPVRSAPPKGAATSLSTPAAAGRAGCQRAPSADASQVASVTSTTSPAASQSHRAGGPPPFHPQTVT